MAAPVKMDYGKMGAYSGMASGIAQAAGSMIMSGIGYYYQQKMDEIKLSMLMNEYGNPDAPEGSDERLGQVGIMAKIESEARLGQFRALEEHQGKMVSLARGYQKSEVELKKAKDQLKVTEARLKSQDATAKAARNSYSLGKPVQIYS